MEKQAIIDEWPKHVVTSDLKTATVIDVMGMVKATLPKLNEECKTPVLDDMYEMAR